MHSYENVLSASKGLLVDAMEILTKTDHKFVVVGGWCPYLRNRTDLHHPGTKDVDILFSDANVRGSLTSAIAALLDHGYLVSAKHDFQLLKELRVGDKAFVFNVDLLHPSETINNPEMMVDHFDLGVTEGDLPGNKHVRSIVLPSSQLIFEGFYSDFDVSSTNPDGKQTTVSVPLIDEAGLILSKCQSIKLKKRPRDSFDIYLILAQENSDATCEKLKQSASEVEPVRELLLELRGFLDCECKDSEGKQFDYNMRNYPSLDSSDPPSDYVIEKLNSIIG